MGDMIRGIVGAVCFGLLIGMLFDELQAMTREVAHLNTLQSASNRLLLKQLALMSPPVTVAEDE